MNLWQKFEKKRSSTMENQGIAFHYEGGIDTELKTSAIEAGLLEENTREEIYESILSSLVHELTHYYQWVLDLKQSKAVSERQAIYFRYRIIDKFYQE